MLRGRIFYRGQFVEAGIEVEDGRIVRIGKLVKGREVKGIILPAGIDVHVHMRDFEEKHKETIESGTLSALHGGICLVVDQPNTRPLVDSAEVYFRRMERAKKGIYVDYTLNLALTRANWEKLDVIVQKIQEKYYLPAVGEVFLQHSSEELQVDYEILRKVWKGKRITLHAEDPHYVSPGTPNFRYRSREAEIVAVKRAVEISDYHFCHISTKDAAELISKTFSTFEVTPHHLLLSEDDYTRLGDAVNVNPPLRKREEAEWLLKNFHLSDVLASDHAPHTMEDKTSGAPGFPGVETMYPIFVALALKGIVDFKTLVERISLNPARIFGFSDYGGIEEGKLANFAVFDPQNIVRIRVEALHSKCGWTPYEGFEAVFPYEVYIRGEEVLKTEEKAGRVLEVG